MKTRKIVWLSHFITIALWLISGCDSGENKTSILQNERPSPTPPIVEEKIISPTPLIIKDESTSPNPPVITMKNITMEEIWSLKRQGMCDQLMKAVDTFLCSGRTDENTKGTCYFLKGDCQRQLGRFEDAKKTFQIIINDPSLIDASWPDPNVRSGRVPVRPQVDVGLRLIMEKEKGRFPEKSTDYTTLAWDYFDKQNYDAATFFAWECIKRFQTDAAEQQSHHNTEYKESLPRLLPNPQQNEAILRQYWALYDVGTCTFIVGQVYEYQADMAVKRSDRQNARTLYENAIKQYRVVVTDYPSAQCFDTHGPWYWSVKEGSEERINRINFRKLREIDPG